MQRDADGKVRLVDTAEGEYGRVHAYSASTAREILNNPKSTRYVPLAKFEEMKREKEIDDAVEARVNAATQKALGSQAGASVASAPVAVTVEKPADDILAAHNAVSEEAVENDDRVTKTGLLKMAVLNNMTGREVDRAEYAVYNKYIKAATADE